MTLLYYSLIDVSHFSGASWRCRSRYRLWSIFWRFCRLLPIISPPPITPYNTHRARTTHPHFVYLPIPVLPIVKHNARWILWIQTGLENCTAVHGTWHREQHQEIPKCWQISCIPRSTHLTTDEWTSAHGLFGPVGLLASWSVSTLRPTWCDG